MICLKEIYVYFVECRVYIDYCSLLNVFIFDLQYNY